MRTRTRASARSTSSGASTPSPSAAVLIAPDSFKGTLTASEVVASVGRGFAAAGCEVDPCPVADGGEGTAEALLAAVGGEERTARAHDPLGREGDFGWVMLADGRAVVEVASATGLHLVAEDERDPERATSAGTGELIAAALAAGAREILVGVGGSATVDGGAGMLGALAAAGGTGDVPIVVLHDVTTPWERAPAVFGPQKGATPAAVERLEARLDALAVELPRDPRGVEATGAAGGISGALWGAHGARLAPGAAFVLEAVGFDARLARARAVVTGEGRMDAQTLMGKIAGEVAVRARDAGVPCHAVVGKNDLDPRDARILGLGQIVEAGDDAALETAGRELAGLI